MRRSRAGGSGRCHGRSRPLPGAAPRGPARHGAAEPRPRPRPLTSSCSRPGSPSRSGAAHGGPRRRGTERDGGPPRPQGAGRQRAGGKPHSGASRDLFGVPATPPLPGGAAGWGCPAHRSGRAAPDWPGLGLGRLPPHGSGLRPRRLPRPAPRPPARQRLRAARCWSGSR